MPETNEMNSQNVILLLQWRNKSYSNWMNDLQRFGDGAKRQHLCVIGRIEINPDMIKCEKNLLELKNEIRQICLKTFPTKYRFSSQIHVWAPCLKREPLFAINPHKSFNPDTNQWESFPYKGK